jgi:hypothetical protein
MANQDSYADSFSSATPISRGVENENAEIAENRTRNADSSVNATTSLSDTSCTRHFPCTTQDEQFRPASSTSKKTHLKSVDSSVHFLNRDFPSSVEQIIFDFFLDANGKENVAHACLDEFFHDLPQLLSSPTPPTPKCSPSLPPPSQESSPDSNAPTAAIRRRV